MAECIHGFEEGLCDSCFPREAPVPIGTKAPVTRTASRSRAAGTGTTSSLLGLGTAIAPRRQRPAASKRVSTVKMVPLATRRIYHVTSLSNLQAILLDGAIRAGVAPEFDLLSPESRQQRAGVEVTPGESAASFVPFSLSPHAGWWEGIRTGAADPRWSSAVRRASLTSFVILVGTVEAVGPDVVISDGDSSSPLARFAVGTSAGSGLINRVLEADPDLQEPEVLAPAEYPLSSVVLLALPNEPVREQVKAMVRETGAAGPKLAVFPPWFQPAEVALEVQQ